MPRRLRLQYLDAIYHVMARGNGRQVIVRDDVDRDRLLEHLGRAAIRCGWRIYAFAIMPNHLHVVLKTPEPNLSRGMQAFLSSYANAWSRRHRFSGHVFQGRYRTELVEDETYLWTVTRYVHLNPVRGRLVEHPGLWTWRCPGSHGTSEPDEASKRTEDLTCSRSRVTGFGWEVAYRAGRRGTDMNGAFQRVTLGPDIYPPDIGERTR